MNQWSDAEATQVITSVISPWRNLGRSVSTAWAVPCIEVVILKGTTDGSLVAAGKSPASQALLHSPRWLQFLLKNPVTCFTTVAPTWSHVGVRRALSSQHFDFLFALVQSQQVWGWAKGHAFMLCNWQETKRLGHILGGLLDLPKWWQGMITLPAKPFCCHSRYWCWRSCGRYQEQELLCI